MYVHLEDLFTCSQRSEIIVLLCLVQRLLEELKQSNSSLISRFDNYSPMLLIRDNFMNMLVPK